MNSRLTYAASAIAGILLGASACEQNVDPKTPASADPCGQSTDDAKKQCEELQKRGASAPQTEKQEKNACQSKAKCG